MRKIVKNNQRIRVTVNAIAVSKAAAKMTVSTKHM